MRVFSVKGNQVAVADLISFLCGGERTGSTIMLLCSLVGFLSSLFFSLFVFGWVASGVD